jgi:hypothetical protein
MWFVPMPSLFGDYNAVVYVDICVEIQTTLYALPSINVCTILFVFLCLNARLCKNKCLYVWIRADICHRSMYVCAPMSGCCLVCSCASVNVCPMPMCVGMSVGVSVRMCLCARISMCVLCIPMRLRFCVRMCTRVSLNVCVCMCVCARVCVCTSLNCVCPGYIYMGG